MEQFKAVIAEDGSFKRRDSVFRNQIPSPEFPAEGGRYHLYVSYACPWANRCLTAMKLKGLDHVISVSVVHPTWQRTRPDLPGDSHCGWAFAAPHDPPKQSPTGLGSFGCEGCVPDTVNNVRFVRDLYDIAFRKHPHFTPTGPYSVPVLWDKATSTIVNNESADLLRILNTAFNDYATHPELDLYPEPLRATIDDVNTWVYRSINNGVYRCGFATTQAAYEQAFGELFDALERCERILSRQRYIAGSTLTEADVRLFQTLIRFDEVYFVYFKTNKALIRDHPAMADYVRDLFRNPAFSSCVNMPHIKTHYYTSHPQLNCHAVIPRGGDAWWARPGRTDRTHLAGV